MVKRNYLETLVNGEVKAAKEGISYSVQMCQLVGQTMEQDFGRLEILVNAQLRKIHSYPFFEPHDSMELVKKIQFLSGCINLLSQYHYENDSALISVMNSVVRKVSHKLRNKRLMCELRNKLRDKNKRVFNA